MYPVEDAVCLKVRRAEHITLLSARRWVQYLFKLV